MALRNPALSSDDLNSAVQLTIDRIIFLRMAEDRGVEPCERLRKLAAGADIYRRFIQDACRLADHKYHSGLFHFDEEPGVKSEPDRLTPRLVVDDKVLKPILTGLYSPRLCEFRALPVEILGNVHEQFLGKAIRLTNGRQATLEKKPEVRKAAGVYYTPACIVDHIVKNTVGVIIGGKSPSQLAGKGGRHPVRISDMACGRGPSCWRVSASFGLLPEMVHGERTGKARQGRLATHRAGRRRLTIGERKRILTTHIFGVDIDAQAVAVAKLSLLLSMFEGETEESLGKQSQSRPFDFRALPNLGKNILAATHWSVVTISRANRRLMTRNSSESTRSIGRTGSGKQCKTAVSTWCWEIRRTSTPSG